MWLPVGAGDHTRTTYGPSGLASSDSGSWHHQGRTLVVMSTETTGHADTADRIAQARRLGHHLSSRVTEVCSHIAPEVELRLLNDLQRRWHEADLSVKAHPTASEPSHRHVSGPTAA